MINPALLVIDVQNDYFPGGTMELVEMELAARNVRELLSIFRKNNWPIVFIQHLALKPTASFFIPDTFGAGIHESIQPFENEMIIIKHFPNSFRGTSLNEHLQSLQISDIVICGAMTHMCIDTSVRAATDLGYSCLLIHDACATRDLAYNNVTVNAVDVQIAYMAALNGSFANVISVEEFVSSHQSQ